MFKVLRRLRIGTFIKGLALSVGGVSVVATLLPLFEQEEWWIRAFDFPRYQISVLSLGSALVLGFFWRPERTLFGKEKASRAFWLRTLMLVALIVCMIYQAYRIYPYTPIARVAVLPAEHADRRDIQVSILVSNVLMSNDETDRLLRLVEELDPDIVLAVETDRKWMKGLEKVEETHPYHRLIPIHNTYGMLFYSKLPLEQTQVRYLIQDDIPSVKTRVVLPSGDRFTFYGIHPRPPAPQESTTSLPRDVELVMVAKEIREDLDEPTIVAGDMNDVAWSDTTLLFLKLAHMLDPRVGRGLFNTFPEFNPLLRVPLDHVFHTDHFRVVSIERQPAIGSDHYPMFVRLSYEPEEQHEQEPPPADEEDIEDANEKIEKAEESPVVDHPPSPQRDMLQPTPTEAQQ